MSRKEVRELLGGVIGLGISACPKKEGNKDDSRADEIQQCNKAREQIMKECLQGMHSVGICQAQASKVCND